MSNIKTLWDRLQRRHVIRAAVAHVVFFWLLVQFADVVLPYVGIVDNPIRWTIIAGVALFPVTVGGAWLLEHPWHSHGRGRMTVDLLVLAVIVLGAGLYAWRNLPEGTLSRTSIVVLPFSGEGDSALTRTISRALTYEINSLLMRSRRFDVIGFESATSALLDGLNLPQVARRLKVKHILTGSIRMDGDLMSIDTRLADENGELIWSSQIRDDVDRLFATQELIASAVARELGGSAGQQKVQETIAQRCEMPADPAVLEKYYTARYHVEKRGMDVDTLYTAVSLYQELIEADPDFAEARSGLAWAYLFINFYDETLDGSEKQENDRKSKEQARQAFALCEHLGEAMVILPNQYDHPNRWINAYQNLAAAVEMQPNKLMLHYHLNRHLVDAGRKSDSREAVRNTYLMNPLSVRAVRSYALALMEPETIDEAVRMFERAAELGREGPNFAAQMKKMYACQKDVECFVENLPPHLQPHKEQMRLVFTVPENAEQLDASLGAARELLKEQPWMINRFNASACWNEHLTPIFFDAYETEAYWYWPNVWIRDCGRVHRLQEFKDLVEQAGLVEYWRQFGWADACRPLGEDDFICDGYPIEEDGPGET